MSDEAEALVGITKDQLKGRQFDGAEIDRLLRQTDLVVAHAAEFERSFLEPVIPALAELPWACSLTEIRWGVDEGLERASIDYLLSLHGRPPSNRLPGDDCRALAYVLEQPLPRSRCTGFKRLISAADSVLVECVLAEHGEPGLPAAMVLAELGFEEIGLRWRAHCATATDADALEVEVVQHAAENPDISTLKMWRVDARSRFTTRAHPMASD